MAACIIRPHIRRYSDGTGALPLGARVRRIAKTPDGRADFLMPRHVDALTAPTLKHLRDRWWDSDFSEFLRETLRPRPGTRILDVGCGDGTAEVMLGRLHISQVKLFAVDREFEHAKGTAEAGSAHNIRLHVAAADALQLPFVDAGFDSTFCVAVLQHVPDLQAAIRELSRVTKPGGRIVTVEPDNAARYWFSSVESGHEAFRLSTRSSPRERRARRGRLSVGRTQTAVAPAGEWHRAVVGDAVPGVGGAHGRSTARGVGRAPRGPEAGARAHRRQSGGRRPGTHIRGSARS